jgi:hypothetical protein
LAEVAGVAAVAADVDADVDAGGAVVPESSDDDRAAVDADRVAVVRPVAEAARVGVPASARWPAIATVATALAAAAAMRERRAG